MTHRWVNYLTAGWVNSVTRPWVNSVTIHTYRDTFRLLLAFAQETTGRTPSNLRLEDVDAVLVGAFLDHLETDRHNGFRTRNARLAAVHSLFRFAAMRHPEQAALIGVDPSVKTARAPRLSNSLPSLR